MVLKPSTPLTIVAAGTISTSVTFGAIPEVGWTVRIPFTRNDLVHGPYVYDGTMIVRREVEEWLSDEIGSPFYQIQRFARHVVVTFKHENDALLFSMRWV